MKVRIDPERCQGHNRCCELAPELFDSDELGQAIARDDGVIPPGKEAQAQLCVDSCPEYAIEIVA